MSSRQSRCCLERAPSTAAVDSGCMFGVDARARALRRSGLADMKQAAEPRSEPGSGFFLPTGTPARA
jgi:hypothetical protein